MTIKKWKVVDHKKVVVAYGCIKLKNRYENLLGEFTTRFRKSLLILMNRIKSSHLSFKCSLSRTCLGVAVGDSVGIKLCQVL